MAQGMEIHPATIRTCSRILHDRRPPRITLNICRFYATDPTNGDQKHGPISAVKSSIRSILDDIKKEQEKEKSGKGHPEQKDVKGVEEGLKVDTTTKEEKPAGVTSTKVDWEEEAQGSFLDKLVDRSELYSPIDLAVPNSPLAGTPSKRPPTQFELRLQQFIQARGPLTVAQYMREVLVSPKGYYMQRDVFGKTGDFVTAPEISQMFGEMVGVWCAHMWEQLGKPPRLKLVEFGPGRGSLMADFLQATIPFKQFQAALEVHFIEVSPKLREIQQQRLEKFSTIPMEWNTNIVEVPDDAPILAVAQEFFDALPVNIFLYRNYKGVEAWREVLVDWDTDGPHYLRFVSAKGKTGASEAVPRWLPQLASHGDRVQICLDGMEILQNIASRVGKHGGGALLIDYGNYGTKGETLVAIRNHQPEHIFQSPGEADVSAWVDFKSLRRALYDSDKYKDITTYGPVSQGEFLRAMGIDFRLVELLKKLDENDPRAEQLISGYERLVGTEEGQMGTSYKAWAFTSKGASPAGFDTAKTPYDDDL